MPDSTMFGDADGAGIDVQGTYPRFHPPQAVNNWAFLELTATCHTILRMNPRGGPAGTQRNSEPG